jgi:hypothetical protein
MSRNVSLTILEAGKDNMEELASGENFLLPHNVMKVLVSHGGKREKEKRRERE